MIANGQSQAYIHFAMKYETRPPRAVIALILGACLGGLFLAIPYAWHYYVQYGWEFFAQYSITNTFGVFMMATLVWLIGIGIFGVPAWILLHKKGLRNWWAGCLAGAVLPAVFTFLLHTRFLTGQTSGKFSSFHSGKQMWQDGVLTTSGWLHALTSSAWMGFGGLVIGLLIWRVAYRRTPAHA